MNQQASMQCIGDGALYNMFCYRHFCLLYSFFSRRSVIYGKTRFSLIKALLFLLQTFRLPAVRFAERYILFHRLFCEYLFRYTWAHGKSLFSSAAKYRFLFYFYVRLFCVPVCCDHIENIMRIFLILQNSYFGFRFPFCCHRELGFLFDFKSRFYIFPLANQWLFSAAWFCIMSLSVIIYLCFHPVSCLRFLSVWMVVRRTLHGCLADIFFALSAAFKTL